MPGNDPDPVATLYVYNAELPNDPDCDALARIATNKATTEVYLFAEDTTSYKSHIASGEKAYADYVIANGQKVEGASAGATVDIVVPGLKGAWCISTVSKGPSGEGNLMTKDFVGLNWNDICEGTYYFSVANVKSVMKTTEVRTKLQQNGDTPNQYRFKDLFAPAKHLVFYKDGRHYASGDAVLRVKPQDTGLTFGSYGAVSVRDVCNWQGEDDGYLDNAMDDTYYCYFWLQYYVSAGNMGYGYDEFYPDED